MILFWKGTWKFKNIQKKQHYSKIKIELYSSKKSNYFLQQMGSLWTFQMLNNQQATAFSKQPWSNSSLFVIYVTFLYFSYTSYVAQLYT